ncbi:flippase [candidate division KSB1 bacterium]|nr:flippase [candidate division KSB1 bacterium]MBL7094762.1 flippase [candidate division KSB1 bacterium]
MNETQKSASKNVENLKTIVEGVRIDLIGRIFNAGIRYLYLLMLAWILGAEKMGLFFLGVVILEFSGVFSRLGLDVGVLKYVALFEGQKDKQRIKGVINSSFLIVLLASLLIGSTVYFSADFIANHIFFKTELKAVLKILAISLPFSTIALVALSVTQAFHTLKYRVYVEFFTNPLLNIFVVLILFYLFGWQIKGVTIAYVGAFFVSATLSIIFVKQLFPDILNGEVKPIYETKKLFRFSAPLMFVSVLNLIIMWTDVLMLGYFKTSADVGVYSAALRTAFFLNFIYISFSHLFAPRISDLYNKKRHDELASLFKIITKWMFTLSFPLFLIIVILSKDILAIFGNAFEAGYLSLIILAVAHIINSAVGSVQHLLMMSENEKVMMYITIIVCVLNFVLNLVLIPRLGINGAALATAISFVLLNLIMLYQVYKKLRIHPYDTKYLKPFLLSLMGGIVLWCVKYVFLVDNLIVLLFVSFVTFVFVYYVIFVMVKGDEADYIVLNTFISTLKAKNIFK